MLRDKLLSASLRRSGALAFLAGFALLIVGAREDASGTTGWLTLAGLLIAFVATPVMVLSGKHSLRTLRKAVADKWARMTAQSATAVPAQTDWPGVLNAAASTGAAFVLSLVALIVCVAIALAVLGFIVFGLRQL